jgi:hypothetical protein
MGGGELGGDMESMLPLMLMSQTNGGDAGGMGNMMQTMMMMKMMKGDGGSLFGGSSKKSTSESGRTPFYKG